MHDVAAGQLQLAVRDEEEVARLGLGIWGDG